MTSNLPRTPETPSHTSPSAADLPSKPVTSPTDTHSMPTPARSVNGSMSSINTEAPSEGASQDDSSLKRKRDPEDQGDQEQKKMHVEKSDNHKVTIADLSENVGELYLFCKTPHPARLPPLSQDLFERYDLTDIAKSVARTKADGSKGVKLRKTYKNHIKDHGLVGSFDAVKKELGAPDTLYAMMIAPSEEWDAQFKRGKEIDKGIPESLLPPGNKIFTMAKGAIPKNLWSSSVLGEVAAPAQAESAKAAQNGARTLHPQSTVARPVKGTAKGDIHRPKRNVKKRTYGDSSYEGYGEGYVDDDTQDTGYSTGDGDDRGGNRKRPKKNPQSQGFGGPARTHSYGPGMVGAYN